MTEAEREALIEKMARSDADFDGRAFGGLGRADKERYLARSKAALAVAEEAIRMADVPEIWEDDEYIRNVRKMMMYPPIHDEYKGPPNRHSSLFYDFCALGSRIAQFEHTSYCHVKGWEKQGEKNNKQAKYIAKLETELKRIDPTNPVLTKRREKTSD